MENDLGSPEPRRSEDRVVKWVSGLLLLVALFLFVRRGLLYCLTAGRDDVFFSLWAGEQFAAGNGLVNYNGEPLEICSSLLHVFIIAAIALFAPDHVYSLNKLTGLAAASGVLLVVYAYRRDFFRSGSPVLALMFALAAIVFNNDFSYWALGGLETPFVAVLLTLYAGVVTRYWLRPTRTGLVLFAVVQCLYVLARPEGFYILFFSAIFLGFVFILQGYRAALLIAAGIPWLFFAGVLAMRWVLFGMFLPNPAYAKTGDLREAVRDGAGYLLDYASTHLFALFHMALLAVLTIYFFIVIIGGGQDRAKRLQWVFVYGLCITVLFFVLVSGGDWMGRSRFLVPVMPCLAILSSAVVFDVARRLRPLAKPPLHPRFFDAVAAAVLAALSGSAVEEYGVDVHRVSGLRQLRESDSKFRNIPLSYIFGTWEGLEDRLIQASVLHYGELRRVAPIYDVIVPELYGKKGHLTILSGQMGLFPYMLKKRYPDRDLYLIDLHGLATREIAAMELGRNLGGVRGGNLAVIFEGKRRQLSDFVLGHDPDVIFVNVLSDAERRAIEKAGFVVLPGGSVSFRPIGDDGQDLLRRCEEIIRHPKKKNQESP
jgi:hypothetical protein